MISDNQRMLSSLSGSFTKRLGPNVLLCSLVSVCVWWDEGEAEHKVGGEAEGGEFTLCKEPNKLLLDNP